MFIPGKGFDRCFCSKEGFNKNSNHKIVSGEIGTVPGLGKSTSMIIISLIYSQLSNILLLYKTFIKRLRQPWLQFFKSMNHEKRRLETTHFSEVTYTTIFIAHR